MKNFIKVCVSLSILVLYGCAGIQQPVASRQLVDDNYQTNNEDAPKELWDSLAVLEEGEHIIVSSERVVLGSWFFSASGKKCRELRSDTMATRIACKDNDSAKWFLVKSVLSSYSDHLNELGGAK